MDTFQSKAIKAVVNEHLKGLLLEIKKHPKDLSTKEMAAWKEHARLILGAELTRYAITKIKIEAKDKIALESQNDVEIAFNRGIVMGLKLFEQELRSFFAGKHG